MQACLWVLILVTLVVGSRRVPDQPRRNVSNEGHYMSDVEPHGAIQIAASSHAGSCGVIGEKNKNKVELFGFSEDGFNWKKTLHVGFNVLGFQVNGGLNLTESGGKLIAKISAGAFCCSAGNSIRAAHQDLLKVMKDADILSFMKYSDAGTQSDKEKAKEWMNYKLQDAEEGLAKIGKQADKIKTEIVGTKEVDSLEIADLESLQNPTLSDFGDVQLEVSAKVGVGLHASVSLGLWEDPDGFFMYGLSAGLAKGLDVTFSFIIGVNNERSQWKVRIGFANLEFEYIMPKTK